MARADTAFVGFYAVEPNYQRMGIGRALWAKTIGRLDDSINVGLYGVPAMSEKYKKSGFNVEDSIKMLIYESDPSEEEGVRVDLLKDITELPQCRLEVIDGNTSEQLFEKLIEYDQSVQMFARGKLLRNYLLVQDAPLTFAIIKTNDKQASSNNQHQSIQGYAINERKSSCCARPSQESIVEDEALSTSAKSSLSISANDVSELQMRSASPNDVPSLSNISDPSQRTPNELASDVEILGYGCIRRDNTLGGLIGPIYANSSDICEVILRNLISSFKLEPGAKYSVMALTSNKLACRILDKIGLTEMDQCSRMFTKFAPTAALSKIYFVHSPNFTLF